MGQYDDITPERLRADLVRFASLLIRLEERGLLLDSIPRVQSILGQLRQKLFAYEVRGSSLLGEEGSAAPEVPGEGPEELDRQVEESIRVVREALQRQEEMTREWKEGDHGRE